MELAVPIFAKHCCGKAKVQEWVKRLRWADGLDPVIEEMDKASRKENQ